MTQKETRSDTKCVWEKYYTFTQKKMKGAFC